MARDQQQYGGQYDHASDSFSTDGSSSSSSASSERVRRKAKRRRDPNKAELKMRLGTCHARRDRIANPPGVHISFTIIVSFHEAFITKVDRAYHVECAYEEVDRTVSVEMGEQGVLSFAGGWDLNFLKTLLLKITPPSLSTPNQPTIPSVQESAHPQ